MGLLMSVLNLCVYCYFGILATESNDKMSDCVYNLKWQNFPLRLQKYVILMITDMQITMYYHGFEVAVLNLNTFQSVSTELTAQWMDHGK